jgi:hypothetical protein
MAKVSKQLVWLASYISMPTHQLQTNLEPDAISAITRVYHKTNLTRPKLPQMEGASSPQLLHVEELAAALHLLHESPYLLSDRTSSLSLPQACGASAEHHLARLPSRILIWTCIPLWDVESIGNMSDAYQNETTEKVSRR